MNTATKSNKSASKADAKTVKNRVGRPSYVPTFPSKAKWTMGDFMMENGVDLETGKGARCSKLTLIKFLAKDMFTKNGSTRPTSLVVRLKGELSDPNSESGRGRKAFMYQLRSKLEVAPKAPKASTPKATKAPAAKAPKATKAKAPKAPKSDVSVNVGTPAPTPVNAVSPETVAYEAQKAALLAPETVPAN